jgi:hypothetical protein
MAKDTKKTMINLDNVDYVFEDMTPQQQTMVNHIHDLDRKIAGAQFSIEQLQVGKAAFINMLKESITKDEE